MAPQPQRQPEEQIAPPRRTGRLASAGRGLARYVGRMAAIDGIAALGRSASRWGSVAFTLRRGKTPPSGPPPDFATEMARQHVSISDIAKRRKQLAIEAWVFLTLALLALAWSVRSLLVALNFSQIVFALASAFVALPMLALAATAAFRHWQIRARRLGGWEEWLRNPKEWLP